MRILAAILGLLALCFGGATARAQVSGQTWTAGAVNYPVPDFSPCDFSVPTSFGNVFYIDQVNGHTQTFYGALTTNPAISPHQGDAAHPWDSLSAVFGTVSGYTGALLATAPGSTGARVIQPGDEVLLMTGSYGAVTAASSANSSFVTFAAAPGQTPLLTTLNISGDHLAFDGIKVQKNPANAILVNITGHNIVANHFIVSAAEYSDTAAWTATDWQNATNYSAGVGTGINAQAPGKCVAVLNPHVYIMLFGIISYKSSYVLVQNPEVDHFTEDGIDIASQFTSYDHYYIHDPVLVGGDHTDFMQLVCAATGCQPFPSHDVWINGGLMVYAADPGSNPPLPNFGFNAVTGCSSITDGYWANVFFTNNACFVQGAPAPVVFHDGFGFTGCLDCLVANNVTDNRITINVANFGRGQLYSTTNTIVVNNLSVTTTCNDPGHGVKMMNNIIMYVTGVSNDTLCFNGVITTFGGTPNTSLPGGNYVDTSGINSELTNIDYGALIYNFHLQSSAPAVGFGRTARPRPFFDFYGHPTNTPPDDGAAAYP